MKAYRIHWRDPRVDAHVLLVYAATRERARYAASRYGCYADPGEAAVFETMQALAVRRAPRFDAFHASADVHGMVWSNNGLPPSAPPFYDPDDE